VLFGHSWPSPPSVVLRFLLLFFFAREPPTPLKKTPVALKKNNAGYLPASSQVTKKEKLFIIIILLCIMKEIRYNVNQSVYQSQSVNIKIADGEGKADCERREGAVRTRKRCAFRLRLLCAHSKPGFSQKQPLKTTCFFCFCFFVVFLSDPPLSHRGLTWFYKDPLPPNRTTWFVCRPLTALDKLPSF